ncbi:MAG: DUF5615 family PIN-like protein [Chloroflexota bacterium]
MKLLLDVHHSPLVAARLRAAGHDVLAAASDPRLASLTDDQLLREATVEGRAVVTENAKDFDRIARTWAAAGEHHAGIIFTSPHRFPRARGTYQAALAAALEDVLLRQDPTQADWVHWLDDPAV